MKTLVVISGKGGTGKTSLLASFASLAGGAVLADCDVDAGDLHLVLEPRLRERDEFRSGFEAVIDTGSCTGCGECARLCRFGAVTEEFEVDAMACEGCGVCAHFCPAGAVTMRERLAGEWFVSETRCGPLVHARLGVSGENSGKLVTLVRRRAEEIACERGYDLLMVDGSPGIGCPVIASITGADLALIVTEPTVAGLHDLKRVAALAAFFRIRAAACINKCDLNLQVAGEIAAWCRENGVVVLGRVPYDPRFTRAQVAGLSLVEHGDGSTTALVQGMWRGITAALG